MVCLLRVGPPLRVSPWSTVWLRHQPRRPPLRARAGRTNSSRMASRRRPFERSAAVMAAFQAKKGSREIQSSEWSSLCVN